MPVLMIVTDLDGTLLDATTYALGPASAVVERVTRAGIPLVLCSSKTRAEMDVLMARLAIDQPFIVENGGAIFVPPSWPRRDGGPRVPSTGRFCVQLGRPYEEIVAALRHAADACGVRIRGFADMSITEVAQACGLTPLQAQLAKMREYDEPFRILEASPRARERFLRTLRREGVHLTDGGRYHHGTGDTDKGRAVEALKSLWSVRHPLLIGLGDAPNDIPLLLAVDVPVIVRRPDAAETERLAREVPRASITELPGPAGWAVAVSHLVDQWEAGELSPGSGGGLS